MKEQNIVEKLGGRYHANNESLLYTKTGNNSSIVELAKISPKIILEVEKPKLTSNLEINISNSIKKENGKVPSILCVICGMTNAAYRRTDGVYVVPITALKN